MLQNQNLNELLWSNVVSQQFIEEVFSNITVVTSNDTGNIIENPLLELELRKTQQRESFNIPSRYNHLYSGKVRETYEHPDNPEWLIIIATDRISTHDVIHKSEIPGKWETLTQISNFWFDVFAQDERTKDIPTQKVDNPQWPEDFPAELKTRSIIVKKASPFPTEAIVRWYLYGSAERWYDKNTGCLETWEFIWKWLKKCSKLSEPMFTPSTKSNQKDINISFEQMPYEIWKWLVEIERTDLDPVDLANTVKDYSLRLYQVASEEAERRWYILGDTKFEFWLDAEGNIILIDEACTPDSSRFWVAISVVPGKEPESGDKEPVRQDVVEFWKNNPDRNRRYYWEEGFEKYSVELVDGTIYKTSGRYTNMKITFS